MVRTALARLRERPVLLAFGSVLGVVEVATFGLVVAATPLSLPAALALTVVLAGTLGAVVTGPMAAHARGDALRASLRGDAIRCALGRHVAGLVLAPVGIAVVAGAVLVVATAVDLARYALDPLARGVASPRLVVLSAYAVGLAGVGLARLPVEGAREGAVASALRASVAAVLARPGAALRGWVVRGVAGLPWVLWAAFALVILPESVTRVGVVGLGAVFVVLRAGGAAFAAAHRAGRAPRSAGPSVSRAAAGRVALACLLVVALGAGAAAVRIGEVRPYAEPGAEPLDGAGPNEAIGVANDHLAATSFAVRTRTYNVSNASRETFRTRIAADYADHEIAVSFRPGLDLTDPASEALAGYLSDGTVASRIGADGSWLVQQRPGYAGGVGDLGPAGTVRPGPAWRVVDRTPETLVLRANGSRAVEELVVGRGSADVSWAGVTATVDPETGRLQRVVVRAVRSDGDRFRHVTTVRYGVEVRRPAGAGSRGIVSLAWDAAIY